MSYRRNYRRRNFTPSPRGTLDVVSHEGQTVKLKWLESFKQYDNAWCSYRSGGCGEKLLKGENISKWSDAGVQASGGDWAHTACVRALIETGKPNTKAKAKQKDAAQRVISGVHNPSTVHQGPWTPPTYNWDRSDEQATINAWWQDPTSLYGVVLACPGAGKTTTVERDGVDLGLAAWYGVFGKAMEEEAAGRMPPSVLVSTINAMGYRCLRAAFPRIKRVDKSKTRKIIHKFFPVDEVTPDVRKRHRRIETFGKAIIEKLKCTLRKGTEEDVRYVVERFRIPVAHADDLKLFIPQVLHIMREEKNAIPRGQCSFADQAWGVVVHDLDPSLNLPGHVIVDECQDTTKAQQEVCVRAAKPGRKILFVGDKHQSIFGFRGADTSAIPNIVEKLTALGGCKIMRLSVTRRCPKLATALANEYCTEEADKFKAAPGAIDGVAVKVPVGSDWLSTIDPQRSLVLCRRNAPNFAMALKCWRMGIPCVIRGKDIAAMLLGFIRQANPEGNQSVNILFRQMERWLERERNKVEEAGLSEGALEELEDKIETIRALAEGQDTVKGIEETIGKLTEGTKGANPIVFSTVHQAKGLEADWIYINDPQSLPAGWAKDAWEVEQEYHLAYVAYSRTKYALVFVGDGPKCGLPKPFGWTSMEDAKAQDPFKGSGSDETPQAPKVEDVESKPQAQEQEEEPTAFPFGANAEDHKPDTVHPPEEEQTSEECKVEVHIWTTLDARGKVREKGSDAIRHVRWENGRPTSKRQITKRTVGFEYHVIRKANALLRERLNGGVTLPKLPTGERRKTYDPQHPERWSKIIEAYKQAGIKVSEKIEKQERVLVLEASA